MQRRAAKMLIQRVLRPSKYFDGLFVSLSLLLILLFSTQIQAQIEKEDWAKNNGQGLIDRSAVLKSTLDMGGPDFYGYYFFDSADSATNAPHYQWIDISNRTTIPIEGDDQSLGPFPIGFTFPFYGQQFTEFHFCTNGFISFTSARTDFLNRPLPTADEPNNLLAAFWDDLTLFDSTRAYRYTNSVDTCIIAWHNFIRFSGTGRYTFEIILTSNGNIVFQYRSISGVIDSHTIGIENSTGLSGLQYVFDNSRNETSRAIYFGLRPPHYVMYDVMPEALRSPQIRGRAGTPITPMVRFQNAGQFSETFTGRVRIFHNDFEVYNNTRTLTNLRPDSSLQSVFPSYTPIETGVYRIQATSELGTDLRRSNDSIWMNYTAYIGIYSLNLEANNGHFVGNNDWEWGHPAYGPPSAHSGSNLWGTVLGNVYRVGPRLSSLISDTLTLDSAAVLTFWHWYEIEALFDGGNVKISTDDGADWSILTPQDGYDGVIADEFFNPLGGQPAFYGYIDTWLLETIDLGPYAGQTVLFKFDFGSDISTVAAGWYIDDVTVVSGRLYAPGWIAGTVSDYSSSAPIPGVLVRAGQQSCLADSFGHYVIRTLPGAYLATASAEHYTSVALDSVVVAAGDTNTLDFALRAPEMTIDNSAVDTSFVQGHTISFVRSITNNGTGPLDYNIKISYGDSLTKSSRSHFGIRGEGSAPQLLNFSDELFVFDPQTTTGDINCLGVDFDGVNFWVTGRHIAGGMHKLYKFDRNGNLLQSYDQNTYSTLGWRDLACDGNFLYAADENELAKIDISTGQVVDTLPRPNTIPSPLRALAYDYRTDHLWAANDLSNIIEFDRTGQTIRSFPNDHHVYGLGWDNVSSDGPWLWVFSQDGLSQTKISQFDPRQGAYTAITFDAIDHNGGLPDLAGGACFTSEWDPTKGVLFCLVMGRSTPNNSFDKVQGYEITRLPNWLRAEPSSDTIPPGGNVNLVLTLDFSDSAMTADSTYNARIEIRNNTAILPQIPVSVGLISDVADNPDLPGNFALFQNYPNPFNSVTKINFALPVKADVKIEIFNILGQRISAIAAGSLTPGYHSVAYDASGLSSGLYFYKLTAGPYIKTGQMTLLK
jgi:hypothetical protein